MTISLMSFRRKEESKKSFKYVLFYKLGKKNLKGRTLKRTT